MGIEDTQQYAEALHFCSENSPEVVARQMARDMILLRELKPWMEAAWSLPPQTPEARAILERLNAATAH